MINIHDCMRIFQAKDCRKLNQYTTLVLQTQFKKYIFKKALRYNINSDPLYLFNTSLTPFLRYKDIDSGLWPSSYPYILGKALNQCRINTSVTNYIIVNNYLSCYCTHLYNTI